MSGSWSFSSDKDSTITLENVFSELLESDQLLIATGSRIVESEFLKDSLGNYYSEEDDMKLNEEVELKKAIDYAKQSDVVVMAIGEHYLQSGEGGSRADIKLPQVQKKLINEISKIGKPMVGIIFSGRPF